MFVVIAREPAPGAEKGDKVMYVVVDIKPPCVRYILANFSSFKLQQFYLNGFYFDFKINFQLSKFPISTISVHFQFKASIYTRNS